jgi:hypothetical protein
VAARQFLELVRPPRRFGDEEDLQQFVHAVAAQVVRHRSDRDAGCLLGVDPVDRRLLRHAAQPEPDGLLRLVEG